MVEDTTCAEAVGLHHIYLNNAGQALLSSEVVEAGRRAFTFSPGEAQAQALQDQFNIRQWFSQIIGCPYSNNDDDDDDGFSHTNICFHPSTAFAMTFAAENIWRCLAHDDNDEKTPATTTRARTSFRSAILLLQDEFPSAVYPWQALCDRSQGQWVLDVVPYPSPDSDWTQAVLNKIKQADDDDDDDAKQKIKVACLTPLHWSDGSLLDLVKIARACRRRGILVIVDATQAAGILPLGALFPRDEDLVDMLACSVHKWLRAPSGHSLVYVNPKLHDIWLPLDQHDRGRHPNEANPYGDAAQNDMGPNGYHHEFYTDARKFDSGGKVNAILVPMLETALREVAMQVDPVKVQKQLKTLVTPLLEWAQDNDFHFPIGPRAYHLVGIRPVHLTTAQMMDVALRLYKEQGIEIAVRCGAFRISPYVDTRPEDIDALIQALSRYIKELS